MGRKILLFGGGVTMKAKIFSLSLLSMIAAPNGGAMETVE